MDLKGFQKVLVIDVESTGLDPERHACIEIGAVLLDDQLEVVDEYDTLIAPTEGSVMDPESMAVNKISMDELKTAPDFKTVIGEFHKRFGSEKSVPTISGWNVWFDVAFMRKLYEKAGIQWPFGHRFLDLQSVAQFFSKFKGVSLEVLVDSLLKEKQTHRAIDDTRQTAKILKLFAEKHLSR